MRKPGQPRRLASRDGRSQEDLIQSKELTRLFNAAVNKINQHTDRRIDQLRRTIMATQADLDAAIASEDSALADLGTKLQTSLGDLTAAIAAGKVGADLQAEVDKVTGHVSQLSAFAAQAVAADPATPAPTPTPGA